MDRNEKTARMWLESIRGGNTNRYCYEELTKALLAVKMSPADIGTSDDELEKLWKEGCKSTALMWLERMRNGDRGEVSDYTVSLPMQLAEAGCTFEDIGSSEEEFERLKRELPPFNPVPLEVIEAEIDGSDLRPALRRLLDSLT